jgi:hypothetical protein
MIKSRRKGWTKDVERMGKLAVHIKHYSENLKGRYLGADGRIILKWTLKNWM